MSIPRRNSGRECFDFAPRYNLSPLFATGQGVRDTLRQKAEELVIAPIRARYNPESWIDGRPKYLLFPSERHLISFPSRVAVPYNFGGVTGQAPPPPRRHQYQKGYHTPLGAKYFRARASNL